MGSCGANRREFEDQSAIKENLSQNNAFLVAKQGLMGIKPNKTNFGLSFGHFGGSYVKGEEEEEAKKGLDTCLDFLWFCLNLLWVLYGFYFVPFLWFS